MRKQTVDIIEDLVSQLIATFTINNAVDNGNGTFTLFSDCTWWLSIKDTIDISGSKYEVESFIINVSITIRPLNGALIPVVPTFLLTVPKYIHGTLKMAQNEIDAINNKTELVPFVYLYEVIKDRKNTDSESMIDRNTELRIFFLNSANTSDWLTDDHYENVIYPMQQMVDLFIKQIEKNKLFTDNLDYECLPLLNISEEGRQENSVFDCNLSGVELRLSAEIRHDLSCENKCKC